MIAKTGKFASCLTSPTHPGLYLHWDDMVWNMFGEVSEVNVTVAEMCKEREDLTVMIFPGKIKCISSVYLTVFVCSSFHNPSNQ